MCVLYSQLQKIYHPRLSSLHVHNIIYIAGINCKNLIVISNLEMYRYNFYQYSDNRYIQIVQTDKAQPIQYKQQVNALHKLQNEIEGILQVEGFIICQVINTCYTFTPQIKGNH